MVSRWRGPPSGCRKSASCILACQQEQEGSGWSSNSQGLHPPAPWLRLRPQIQPTDRHLPSGAPQVGEHAWRASVLQEQLCHWHRQDWKMQPHVRAKESTAPQKSPPAIPTAEQAGPALMEQRKQSVILLPTCQGEEWEQLSMAGLLSTDPTADQLALLVQWKKEWGGGQSQSSLNKFLLSRK